MADILDGPSQHSTGGFQGAPVSKFLTGASIVGHVALHVPLFASFRNFLHCNLSRKTIDFTHIGHNAVGYVRTVTNFRTTACNRPWILTYVWNLLLKGVSENGQWWRLVTSKLIFIDTKDAIFCLILLYQFRYVWTVVLFSTTCIFQCCSLVITRIFERRYGSRNFSSQLLATSFFTTFIELLIALGLSSISEKPYPLGSLALGP